jgi:protocatechuate 3,4-dioxygenase beta subunit
MRNTFYSTLIMSVACAIVFMGPSKVIAGQEHMLLSQLQAAGTKCNPTPPDSLGPFYKAGAPVRASVGEGYELWGVVKSSADCAPIANAGIELWLTNPAGDYDDDHRATIYSDESGAYRFESNFPPDYSGRPHHIHIRVSADGFNTLATQHYPETGQKAGEFDLVLVPMH